MVRVQIVCRNASEKRVKAVLARFGLESKSKVCTGHMLIELHTSDPTDKILEMCRRSVSAYLRIVAYEKGGGREATSDATCVAGIEGQPLRPISLTLKGERANREHALFGSRSGLVLANAWRRGSTTTVSVTIHRVNGFKVMPPEPVIKDEFDCAPQEWFTDLQTRMDLDKYVPLVRSVLRKAECTFCTHCHYREVDERREA